MLAKTNELGQRGSHTFLVVRNQDAHTAVAELSMPTEFLSQPGNQEANQKSH
jgi:hypothetical protein